MAHATLQESSARVPKWHHLTTALVGGLVVASAMFFLIVVAQTPGLEPPPQSAALFVVTTTAGVVSYLLLARQHRAAYPMALFAGLSVVLTLALVGGGTYGPVGTATNPIGPISYVVLGLAVVVTAGLAWRAQRGSDATLEMRSEAD